MQTTFVIGLLLLILAAMVALMYLHVQKRKQYDLPASTTMAIFAGLGTIFASWYGYLIYLLCTQYNAAMSAASGVSADLGNSIAVKVNWSLLLVPATLLLLSAFLMVQRQRWADMVGEKLTGTLIAICCIMSAAIVVLCPYCRLFLSYNLLKAAQTSHTEDLKHAHNLETLSSMAEQLGDNEKAATYLQAAQKIYSAQQKVVDVARDLNRLARITRKISGITDAERYYTLAISMLCRDSKTAANPTEAQLLSDSINNLAILQESANQLQQSSQTYITGLASERSLLGKQSSYVAQSLIDLADLWQRHGHSARAARDYREAAELLKSQGAGSADPRIEYCLKNMQQAQQSSSKD